VVKFNDNKKETRKIFPRGPREYPAQVAPRPVQSTRALRPTRIRPSLTPGTVVILLAGRFKGQRAVVLKSLPSGLLLITGPFKINGIPLRRVNQAYVIATSTKVDLTGVTVPQNVNDHYFRTQRAAETKESTQKAVVVTEKKEEKKKQIDQKRIADQKAVDTPLLANIKKVPSLADYLGSQFRLRNGDYPHNMKF